MTDTAPEQGTPMTRRLAGVGCSPKTRLVILWQVFEALDFRLRCSGGTLRVSSGEVSLEAGEVWCSARLGCGERRVGCVAARGLWEAAAGAVGEGSSLGMKPKLGRRGNVRNPLSGSPVKFAVVRRIRIPFFIPRGNPLFVPAERKLTRCCLSFF